MTKILFSDVARVDYVAAVSLIREYFDRIQSDALREKHISSFKSEFKSKLQKIKETPLTFPIKSEYPFMNSDIEFRWFTAHWFTVFYEYVENENEVWILFIRSSKSDFSNIVFMDRSHSDD